MQSIAHVEQNNSGLKQSARSALNSNCHAVPLRKIRGCERGAANAKALETPLLKQPKVLFG